MFDIQPLTGTFGAEIRGVDMAAEPDAEVVEKLLAALAGPHGVLVAEDEHLVLSPTRPRSSIPSCSRAR